MYLCGKEMESGEYVKNTICCLICKRMVINTGISRVIIRDSKTEYRIIDAKDWINNDDILEGNLGY